MALILSSNLLDQIHEHGQAAYPEEGAGLLLGSVDGDQITVEQLYILPNAREDEARHNRYLLTPQDYLRGEMEAARLGMDVVGVFHSHPDHPNRPSEFDREWALPGLSYVITSVEAGKAAGSRSWQLSAEREKFNEQEIRISETVKR